MNTTQLINAIQAEREHRPVKPTTILGAFKKKFANYLYETPLKQIFYRFLYLCFGVGIGVAIVFPSAMVAFLENGFAFKNYVLPKLALWCVLFAYWRHLLSAPRKTRVLFNRMKRKLTKEKTIDGIPAMELADYLIRNKSFKREGLNGARETFGLSMKKYNRIAQNLEKTGVLVRGDNNSRVLDETWTRQTLVDFLKYSRDSRELSKKVNIVNRLTANPKIRLAKQELVG